MHGDPEYAKGTLFRATQQINELTGEEELQALIHDGVLVVDETMKTIADAPRCEHGKIDEHFTEYHPLKDRQLDGHLCLGAPELRSLLDALIGETGDKLPYLEAGDWGLSGGGEGGRR